MKTLSQFINEKLKISNSVETTESKGYNIDYLNVDIKDINQLRNVLHKYFDIEPTKILSREVSWKYFSGSHYSVTVHDRFSIKFMGRDGSTCVRELRVAKLHKGFAMQVRVRNYKGNMEECDLAGSNSTEFKVGDNLLAWLNNIKDLTENKKVGKNINLMLTFDLMQ